MTARQSRSFFVLSLPVLIFSAFLTEISFIPTLANNVGLFELLGTLIIVFFLLSTDRRSMSGNRIIWLIGSLVIVTAASLIGVRQELVGTGLVQVSILIFLFFFLLSLYNLFLNQQIGPDYLLRWITIAAAIVGPWILRQGFLFSTDIGAVGPFRNRSHMGIYMLTAFWLVLIYSLWPSRERRPWLKVPICLVALSLSLYAVAISGRRSVYLSLFAGLIGLILVFTLVLRRNRVTVGFALAFAVGFLALLYTQGPAFLPRSDFFQSRVGLIGSRLRMASDAVSGASDFGFLALQMEGVKAAFSSHPILGIGWGTFHEWELNPSGHEVHSTPLKFLAEAGLVGLLLYLILLFTLISGSARLALRMRRSPYAASYLVLAVATSSLALSHMYNRHLTERTFWLLLLVFLVLEAFAFGYERARLTKRAAPTEASRSDRHGKAAGAVRDAQRP